MERSEKREKAKARREWREVRKESETGREWERSEKRESRGSLASLPYRVSRSAFSHFSLLLPLSSLLTPLSSLLVLHSSLLASHSSLLFSLSSFFTPRFSLLFPLASPDLLFLTPHSSYLTPRSSTLPSALPITIPCARPTKRPDSTTPQIVAIRRSRSAGSLDDVEGAVQNVVAVVRNERPVLADAQPCPAPEVLECPSNVLPAEGDHFHRQRECSEAVLEFGFVDNDDFQKAGRGHEFFAKQRAAAALDEVERGIDLVGAVDGQVYPRGLREVDKRNPFAFRLYPGLLRRGNPPNPKTLPNTRAQLLNRVERGGSPSPDPRSCRRPPVRRPALLRLFSGWQDTLPLQPQFEKRRNYERRETTKGAKLREYEKREKAKDASTPRQTRTISPIEPTFRT